MFAAVTDLLERKIGLSFESIGYDAIRSAVNRHMRRRGIRMEAGYLASLNSEEFIEELIELVVIPETWFFRDRKSFEFLGAYAGREWLPANSCRNLRLLSMPCSTGEEPYTMVMALLDSGFPLERFQVDAIDVSEKSLEKAKEGVYGWSSFRGNDLSFRQRYFQQVGENFKIVESLRGPVRFFRDNALGQDAVPSCRQYDIIFCRNLVIYLTLAARKKLMAVLDGLLAPEGLLFIGHTETMAFADYGFQKIDSPGLFVCRRAQDRQGNRIQGESKWIGQSKRANAPVETPRVMPPNDRHTLTPIPCESLEAPEVRYQSALRLADQGRLVEAAQICRNALGTDPMHLEANFLMGLILMEMRHEDEAAGYFEKVIYLNPHHDQAIDYVALIETKRSNLMRADLLRQRARRIREK